jgi:hypothetical protein
LPATVTPRETGVPTQPAAVVSVTPMLPLALPKLTVI